MFITIILSFFLTLLTLLSTSFHLPNLSLFFLLLIFSFRQKHFGWLVILESLVISIFGHISLGLSLLVVTILVGLFSIGRENILPGRRSGSLILAVCLIIVWEVVNNLIL